LGKPAGELKVSVNYIPSHPEYLYAIGGSTDQWECTGGLVEMFEPVEQTWNAVAPLPTPRSDIASANLLGYIYAAGGNAPTPTTAVERYDIHANKWEAVAPLNHPRAGCALVACAGKLYAIGGATDLYGNGTCTVESYDPTVDMWVMVAPMECERRRGCAAVQSGGFIFVMGGEEFDVDAVPPRRETTGWVERFDPRTGRWMTMSPMPTARGCLTAVAMEDRILAIGGIGEGESNADCCVYATVEAYDPAEDTWVTLAPLGVPRAKLAAGLVEGKLYVCGGHTYDADECKDIFHSTVEKYDSVNNSWQAVTALGISRACFACAPGMM